MKHNHLYTVAGLLATTCLAVTLTGCPSASPSSASAVKPVIETGTKKSRDITAANTVGEFLHEINLNAEVLPAISDDFKKVISEPRTDADREGGFSAEGVRDHFAVFKGKLPDAEWQSMAVKAIRKGVRSVVLDAGASRCIFIRVDEPGKVDWFQVTAKRSEVTTDSNAEAWTTMAFLSALLDRDDRLAAALLSPAYRASLAPVFSKADEARGYNPGTLAEKLKSFRGDATAFEITNSETVSVKGNMITPGGKKPFTMKLTNGPRSFERLVDSFTIE